MQAIVDMALSQMDHSNFNPFDIIAKAEKTSKQIKATIKAIREKKTTENKREQAEKKKSVEKEREVGRREQIMKVKERKKENNISGFFNLTDESDIEISDDDITMDYEDDD